MIDLIGYVLMSFFCEYTFLFGYNAKEKEKNRRKKRKTNTNYSLGKKVWTASIFGDIRDHSEGVYFSD